MTRHFDYLKTTRANLLKATADLDLETLNKIPSGFNNNIAWNMAHCLVTQYLLCYGLSGQPLPLDSKIVDRYRKGAKPTEPMSAEDLAFFRKELENSPAKMEADYNAGLFTDFKVYPTSYNVELQSTEDAIRFNNIHEGLHLGYVMALKRAV
ncbi:MAG: DinB family protein [Saprospiraceae bacterium]